MGQNCKGSGESVCGMLWPHTTV